ncbi:MAG: CTP synthase [Candidatus Saccharibacteria bacterium]|nr:CTP synthase [Candidatus Saccharibacteria bacterium]
MLSRKGAFVGQDRKCKYIFVTGGVLSGVGKGITAASIGAILKAKGFNVTIQKCDPYLNVDAGLLNPVEHGECFVTHDGAETDLDLGHYERFLDFETSKYSITLSGAIYKELIERERAGGFHGRTVQLVPHFTGLVCEKIKKASAGSDIHIVEIGGTVGDYEGLPFIEAIRLFANEVGRRNCLYVDVVYVPFIHTSNELKTKPAQNALKDLRGFGIVPDIVCVRTEKPCGREICEKIAAFSGISPDAVVNLPDIKSVYEVPFRVLKSGVLSILNDFVGDDKEPDMRRWEEFSRRMAQVAKKTVKIGLVAKYVGNDDAYICVTEALKAAAVWSGVNLDLVWVNAEEVENNTALLEELDGIVVPGGFGARGVEGKIKAAEYALANNIPYLGLCLGLQVACIAAARNGGIKNANSEEFGASEEDKNNVIYIMEEQRGKESTGGTMRLGDYKAILKPESNVAKIYEEAARRGEYEYGTEILEDGSVEVIERHRHRYEVNKRFIEAILAGGVAISGLSPDGELVEFVEAPNHKFFIATQAHPEFKSRPLNPHPLFLGFIEAVKGVQ